MKSILFGMLVLCATMAHPASGGVYSPTSNVGEFLRQFERACNAGDEEWIRSAVDKEGVVAEGEAVFFGIMGPKEGGESISELSVVAAADAPLPPANIRQASGLKKNQVGALA